MQYPNNAGSPTMPHLEISTAPHRSIDSHLAIAFIITCFFFSLYSPQLGIVILPAFKIHAKHGERRDNATPFQQGTREEQC
jgi:hypothetical protein